MELKIKLFSDGADKKGMLEMYSNTLISGFTTNPTLMKIAGVKDYKSFALDILSFIKVEGEWKIYNKLFNVESE